MRIPKGLLWVYLIVIATVNVKGQGSIAIIETKEHPACSCTPLYSVFHQEVWDSDVYDKKMLNSLWQKLRRPDNEEKLKNYVNRYTISYFLQNEIKEDSVPRQTKIVSTIYDTKGNEIHQLSSSAILTSHARNYGIQINKEMDFLKDKGHLMETLIVEHFETSEDEYRNLQHDEKISEWLYNQLIRTEIINDIVKFDWVADSKKEFNFIDGQISPYNTDTATYVKVDLIIYIRSNHFPINGSKKFILKVDNYQKVGRESNEYWTELLDLIKEEFQK